MKKIYNQSWIRISLAVLLVFIISAASVSSVHAAGVDDDGIIEEGEIIYDDVVLNAENVRMDGVIEGNLLASGYSVTINGTVTGDAFLFANEIIIGKNASIQGNLFGGAQTIQVAGKINGSLAAGSSALFLEPGASISRNVYYGGFSLETSAESSIGVDLFAGNYQIVLDGLVGRDVTAGAVAVEINGTIQRDATFDLGDSTDSQVYFPMPPGVSQTLQPGLRVSDSAHIGGNLKYTSQMNQSSRIQAEPQGTIIFQTPVPNDAPEVREPSRPNQDSFFWVAGRYMLRLLKTFWENFISLLLVGALVTLLLPELFKRTAAELKRQPLASSGFGLLTVVLGYIGLFLAGIAILAVSILLSLLSLGGLKTATFGFGFASLGITATVFTMLIIYVSKIVVAYIAGNWILSRIAPDSKAADSPFWGMALGVFIYSILRVIPIFGWLLAFIVIILGMGAFWLTYRGRQRPIGTQAAEVPAEVPSE